MYVAQRLLHDVVIDCHAPNVITKLEPTRFIGISIAYFSSQITDWLLSLVRRSCCAAWYARPTAIMNGVSKSMVQWLLFSREVVVSVVAITAAIAAIVEEAVLHSG